MRTEDFVYIANTEKGFEDAVVSVMKTVEQKGWTIFGIHDVRERLAAKGFEQPPLKIIEICKGKYANHLLNKDRLISVCMPCKINVLEDGAHVRIVGMRPTMITMLFPEVKREDVEEVEKELKEIIEAAR